MQPMSGFNHIATRQMSSSINTQGDGASYDEDEERSSGAAILKQFEKATDEKPARMGS